MKVIDKQTGCALESENPMVTDSWAANGERYQPYEDAPAMRGISRAKRETAPAKGDGEEGANAQGD